MTAAAKPTPGLGMSDWKRVLIIVLCIATLLSCLFLVQVNAVQRKTEEAQALTGFDFLLGHTTGKSEGSPHPLVIAVILFAVWGICTAAFMPDKFLYSILSAIFLMAAVFLLRFDITYQAKGELDRKSVV